MFLVYLKDLRTHTEALSISGPDAVRDVKVRDPGPLNCDTESMLYMRLNLVAMVMDIYKAYFVFTNFWIIVLLYFTVLSLCVKGACDYDCI